jgi:hypothetical protein
MDQAPPKRGQNSAVVDTYIQAAILNIWSAVNRPAAQMGLRVPRDRAGKAWRGTSIIMVHARAGGGGVMADTEKTLAVDVYAGGPPTA